ncbi:hypothetical protein BVX95_00765 [archaeon D22]|nr:hypothetical protein BVX95_00765 [archaeon D22]
MAVENNDKVKIHYTGKFDDGEVFDSSEGREPLEFVIGKGMVIPGFEKAVMEMNVGEEKTVEIEPEDGYGPRMEELKQEVPKDSLPEGITPEVGMMLSAQGPQGQMIPVKVVEVNETNIKIDLNHPLAGKKLNFTVKLEEVVKAADIPEEEKKEGDACAPSDCSGCGGGCH